MSFLLVAAIFLTVAIVVAIVFWRFPREPRWAGVFRFIAAALITWNALASWESDLQRHRMQANPANDHDTGSGAAMVIVGWIPACVLAGGPCGIRLFVLRSKQREKSG